MPNSEVLLFTDPDEYQGHVRSAGTDLSVYVTAPGDYRVELTRVKLHQIRVQSGRPSLPQISRVGVEEGISSIVFLADENQPPMRHSGQDILPSNIVASASGTEYHKVHARPLHWMTLSVATAGLAVISTALTGRDAIDPTEARLIKPSPHLMKRLRSLSETACHLAETAPDILAHPEVARALEQEMVRAMVGCMTADTPSEVPNARQRFPVMRRLEQFLEANEERPIYLPEICAAIGVTDRTLRLYCIEHLGTNPHNYLWLRRMNLARRSLTRADTQTSTVTEIATEHGFGELGRFAVAYRKLFGEPPSVTLRRAPDDRRPTPCSLFR